MEGVGGADPLVKGVAEEGIGEVDHAAHLPAGGGLLAEEVFGVEVGVEQNRLEGGAQEGQAGVEESGELCDPGGGNAKFALAVQTGGDLILPGAGPGIEDALEGGYWECLEGRDGAAQAGGQLAAGAEGQRLPNLVEGPALKTGENEVGPGFDFALSSDARNFESVEAAEGFEDGGLSGGTRCKIQSDSSARLRNSFCSAALS